MRVAELVPAALILGLCPGTAGAYCLQTTHDDDTCGADSGVPLAWRGNCVHFSLHEAGSADLPLDVVQSVIRQSFVAWHNAARREEDGPCSYITFIETVLATCDRVEYRKECGNMNLVVFREAGWTSERNHSPASMGLTTVLFDPESGQILSADMELNGENFTFTVDQTNVDADLANTATHEAGHVIGLAHSPEQTATMYGSSTSGETLKATLHADDVEAVCTTYPIADDPGFCSEPPGGLDTTCSECDDGCCSISPGLPAGRPALLLTSAIALAIVLARRMKPRR